MKSRKGPRVLALKAWTIKAENGKFFMSPTASFENKHRWRGPYRSLHLATTAVARKLAEEFSERNMRLENVS